MDKVRKKYLNVKFVVPMVLIGALVVFLVLVSSVGSSKVDSTASNSMTSSTTSPSQYPSPTTITFSNTTSTPSTPSVSLSSTPSSNGSDSTYTIKSISCMTSSLCLSVGASEHSVVILKTIDSGSSWSNVTNVKANDLEGIDCIDSTTCIIVGNYQGYGIVFKTTNSGSSFESITIPGSITNLTSISCILTYCAISGWGNTHGTSQPKVIDSTDSGSTFRLDTIEAVPEGVGYLSSISCSSIGNCLAVGSGSTPGTIEEAISYEESNDSWGVVTPDESALGYSSINCSSDTCIVGEYVLAKGSAPGPNQITSGGVKIIPAGQFSSMLITQTSTISTLSCIEGTCILAGIGENGKGAILSLNVSTQSIKVIQPLSEIGPLDAIYCYDSKTCLLSGGPVQGSPTTAIEVYGV